MGRSGRKQRAMEIEDVEAGGSDEDEDEEQPENAFEDAKQVVTPFVKARFASWLMLSFLRMAA